MLVWTVRVIKVGSRMKQDLFDVGFRGGNSETLPAGSQLESDVSSAGGPHRYPSAVPGETPRSAARLAGCGHHQRHPAGAVLGRVGGQAQGVLRRVLLPPPRRSRHLQISPAARPPLWGVHAPLPGNSNSATRNGCVAIQASRQCLSL